MVESRTGIIGELKAVFFVSFVPGCFCRPMTLPALRMGGHLTVQAQDPAERCLSAGSNRIVSLVVFGRLQL